jgi:hypothetical protein
MTPNDPSQPSSPPKGLLGHILAASKQMDEAGIPESPTPVVDQQPVPPNSSIDPTYAEPLSLARLREMLTNGDVDARSVAELALGRAEVLEKVVLPFCLHGFIMSNARMCLAAMGRDDPAGGVWFTQPQNIRMQPNEKIFYEAIDAVGRQRAEAHAMSVFDKINAAKDAAAERTVHVEAGGQTH